MHTEGIECIVVAHLSLLEGSAAREAAPARFAAPGAPRVGLYLRLSAYPEVTSVLAC
jgi:hypothetical protein